MRLSNKYKPERRRPSGVPKKENELQSQLTKGGKRRLQRKRGSFWTNLIIASTILSAKFPSTEKRKLKKRPKLCEEMLMAKLSKRIRYCVLELEGLGVRATDRQIQKTPSKNKQDC
jgi:hypothetical protein